MPKSVARARFFGESPPSALPIVRCDTTAWTMAERVKPRMSGQRISQLMLKAMKSASSTLVRIVMIILLADTCLLQRERLTPTLQRWLAHWIASFGEFCFDRCELQDLGIIGKRRCFCWEVHTDRCDACCAGKRSCN